MRKTSLAGAVMAALSLAAGCVVRHPTGYDIGALGVSFSHGESRDFMSSYSDTVPQADAATFVALTNGRPWFGKDKRRVYFEQFEIEGADPATFRVIGTDAVQGAFSADKDSVFFEQFRLAGANPATIDISRSPFVTDGKHVYDRYAIIPGAVWPVEQMRGLRMVKDASGAFFAAEDRQRAGQAGYDLETYYTPFVPCDAATFPAKNVSGYAQSMDAKCAYQGAQRIPLTDRATFAFLDWGWSRDSGAVFYETDRVAGADPATAEVVRSPSARVNPDDYFDRSQGVYFLRDRHGCWRDAKRPVEACPTDATSVRTS